MCHKTKPKQTKPNHVKLNLRSSSITLVEADSSVIPEYPYLPTPPVGQDMPQGQLLRGV